MKPYQERVIEEKKALDVNCEKLETFLVDNHIFGDQNLDTIEEDQLQRQLFYMKRYSSVLGERIAAFN